MSLYQPEPVEISTRMRPGEWTEASLEELVATYQSKILEMGAPVSEVVTEVVRNDDGSVAVAVSWNKGSYAEEHGGGGFTDTESTVDTAGPDPAAGQSATRET